MCQKYVTEIKGDPGDERGAGCCALQQGTDSGPGGAPRRGRHSEGKLDRHVVLSTSTAWQKQSHCAKQEIPGWLGRDAVSCNCDLCGHSSGRRTYGAQQVARYKKRKRWSLCTKGVSGLTSHRSRVQMPNGQRHKASPCPKQHKPAPHSTATNNLPSEAPRSLERRADRNAPASQRQP